MAGDCKLAHRLPQKLLSYLMPFQKSGVEFAVAKKGKCLIADEMGLGKTIQAIAVACYYRQDWPMLVIMPSSLRYPWLEELEKWLPDIHPHDINLIQSGTDASGIGRSRVTLVTFGLLSSPSSGVVKEALMNQKFRVVIVDECHYIRNFRTACSQCVVPLVKQAQRAILLSGTPALARPVELHPQLDALCPGKFGSWWTFTSHFCDAKIQYFGKQRRRKVDGASNLEELQSRLTTEVMIRREKKDVLTQLPPKQRQRVLFDLKDSDMKTEILDTFDELQPHLSRAGPDLSQAGNISLELQKKKKSKPRKKLKVPETDTSDQPGETTSTNSVEKSNIEKPTANGKQKREKEKKPSLEGQENFESDQGEKKVTMLSLISKLYKLTAEAKIGPVKDYVSLLCENQNLKFLVFAYHHCMMDGLQQTLWEKKVKFIRIDGNTKPSERLYFVQQFQSDPDCRVAILSILAAGVGLTFTAAKLVVFAEMYWTPGVMVQCEDRAHRIGQTSCVPVHYLVAKATMDEWVWSAVCKKTTVVTATLNGRVQSLEAGPADQYQVEVLSNADAWTPSEDTPSLDITSLLMSQQTPSQRSIKDFLTSSQGSKNSQSGSKRSSHLDSQQNSQDSHNEKPETVPTSPILITLSDEDESEPVNLSEKYSKTTEPQKVKKLFRSGKRKRDPDVLETKPKSKREKCNVTDVGVVEPLRTDNTDVEDFSIEKAEFSRRKLLFTPKTNQGEVKREYESWLSPLASGVGEGEPGNNDQGQLTSASMVKRKTVRSKVKATWDCSACTFLNHNSLPYCEICETPKKCTEPKPAPLTPEDKNQKHFDDVKTNPVQSRAEVKLDTSHCDMDIELPEIVCNSKRKALMQNDLDNSSYKSETEILSSINENSDNQCLMDFTKVQSPERNSSQITNAVEGEAQNNLESTMTKINEGIVLEAEIQEKSGIHKSHSGLDIDDIGNSEAVSTGSGGEIEDKSLELVQTENCVKGSDCRPEWHQNSSMDEERVAALSLFVGEESPGVGQGDGEVDEDWLCMECNTVNPGRDGHCEGCLASKPPDKPAKDPDSVEKRVIDLDSIPVYNSFLYCCSKYTGRVYIFDKDERSLDVNFLPLDVTVGNVDGLPDLLLHPANIRLIKRFIQEWNRLSETKRRFLVRHTEPFESPLAAYEQLKCGKPNYSINRHLTKVVRDDGVPLCVNCEKPYENSLLKNSTIQNAENAWYLRFCSHECSHTYWMKTHNDYLREQVFDAERGVCQLCGVDAHSVFRQIRDTPDQTKRIGLLKDTPFSKLTAKQKTSMVMHPTPGLFWHVDHIVPVWEGGGECDIDNLRTLCSPCHQSVTAEQTRRRNRAKKLGGGVGCRDITCFFKPT